MKKFSFRLEAVLKLRRHEFERKERAFAVARSRAAQMARDHDAAGAQAAERAAIWIERARLGLDSARVGVEQFGLRRAFVDWRETGARVEEAKAVAEQARIELTAAATKMRALESLRERAKERHRLEVQREEIAILDEIGARNAALERARAAR